jgi:hypothetical protein
MKQSRIMSLVEALANVAVGYCIAVMTQVVVFPLFGLQASLAQNLGIGAVFTVVSLVRSYVLRRLFEALGRGRTASSITSAASAPGTNTSTATPRAFRT